MVFDGEVRVKLRTINSKINGTPDCVYFECSFEMGK